MRTHPGFTVGGCASIAFQRYPQLGLAIGLDGVLFVMAVMGGRVIPAFTNSAIPNAGARRNKWVEYGALGSVLLLLVLDVLQMPAWPVALLAAVFHAVRLALWSPWTTRTRPILWILHVSYAWIVVHLALRGLAGIDLLAPGLATHALTVGAIGGLTLGMMTRTSRGHTARPLNVGGKPSVADGAGAPSYVAIYEIDSPEVMLSDAWQEAAEAGRWPGEVRPYTFNRHHIVRRKI